MLRHISGIQDILLQHRGSLHGCSAGRNLAPDDKSKGSLCLLFRFGDTGVLATKTTQASCRCLNKEHCSRYISRMDVKASAHVQGQGPLAFLVSSLILHPPWGACRTLPSFASPTIYAQTMAVAVDSKTLFTSMIFLRFVSASRVYFPDRTRKESLNWNSELRFIPIGTASSESSGIGLGPGICPLHQTPYMYLQMYHPLECPKSLFSVCGQ